TDRARIVGRRVRLCTTTDRMWPVPSRSVRQRLRLLPLSVQKRSVLAAEIVDRAAGWDGPGKLSGRPETARLECFPRPWRAAILDQQPSAATGITDHRDPTIGQQYLALVPGDPLGRRIRILDPRILWVIAHPSSSPRSAGPEHNRRWIERQCHRRASLVSKR